jgi:hypothetical protein
MGMTGGSPAVVGAGSVGIAAGGGLPWKSPADLQKYMECVRSLGATWVRFDIDWSQIQPPGPHTYHWQRFDQVVRAARAANLQVLGIITYTPAWARAGGYATNKCAPNATEFGLFAGDVARHYRSMGVRYWEIWNEPNFQYFWESVPSPREYTQVLRAAYKAIKHAEGDSVVIAGALANCPSGGSSICPAEFLRDMYADGARGYFDAISVHPYTYPLLPTDSSSENPWKRLLSLRRLMVEKGDAGKRIWITEYGTPTDGPGTARVANSPPAATDDHVSESVQAQMVVGAIVTWRSYRWAGPFFWYSLIDSAPYGALPLDAQNYFGLLRSDGAKKSAFFALKRMDRVAAVARSGGPAAGRR